MTKQSHIFSAGEGEAWMRRNKGGIFPEIDPVLAAIEETGIRPKTILEVGCANGWRIKILRERYKSDIYGVDPGAKSTLCTVADPVTYGAAHHLGFNDAAFDMVIYGFCLYLCDREDLFQIAEEGDRVLKEGGHLIVYDFHQPDTSYSRPYSHRSGVRSFKMDHAALWLANPAYRLVHRRVLDDGDNRTAVTILKKDTAGGWPLNE